MVEDIYSSVQSVALMLHLMMMMMFVFDASCLVCGRSDEMPLSVLGGAFSETQRQIISIKIHLTFL